MLIEVKFNFFPRPATQEGRAVDEVEISELRAGRPAHSQARTLALRSAGVFARELQPRLAAWPGLADRVWQRPTQAGAGGTCSTARISTGPANLTGGSTGQVSKMKTRLRRLWFARLWLTSAKSHGKMSSCK